MDSRYIDHPSMILSHAQDVQATRKFASPRLSQPIGVAHGKTKGKHVNVEPILALESKEGGCKEHAFIVRMGGHEEDM